MSQGKVLRYHLVYFSQFKQLLQADMCADLNSKSTAQAFDYFLIYRAENVSMTLCSKIGFKRQFRGMSTVLHFIIPVTWNNKISLKPKNNDSFVT